ncbi:aminopeptidase N-like isoform X2 [Narcine bancroftii]|uniref:aminopeptidase N-like isoform X2 n=1 Tax=Narcine bancroftii TaxID=1343680 RepID=UPI0038312483
MSALTLLGLSLVLQTLATVACDPSVSEGKETQVRTPHPLKPWESAYLPNSLKPISYEVQLWPWLFREKASGLFLFHGRSKVTLACLNQTKVIVLHSKALNYTKPPRVFGRDTLTVRKYWQEKANEYLVVLLDKHLEKGKVYSLHTAFSGELTPEMAGLYRCQYQEEGSIRFLAVTMMQPTNARKIFPCFDDPALKATFDLTVIHRPQHSVISNMPPRATSEMWVRGQVWLVTRFQRTPLMSPYLLACVVSDFRFIEETSNGVTIRVWARKQAVEGGQGDFALQAAGRLLHFYEQQFQLYYPLKKLDLVAVPCFDSGGMENWGVIIFRETNLLFQAGENSESSRQSLLLVLAHELVHQWFGNLVTIQWWNDLWLNEGFATYFSYLGNTFINPDWTVGASVLRMVSNFLTEKVFLQGLLSYLKEFSFRTVTYTDLRTHLQKAVNNQSAVSLPTNLKSILDTWVLQLGYPVVTVNTSSGLLSQQHFLLDSSSTVARTSKFGYRWYVPVTWQMNTTLQNMIWINRTTKVFVRKAVVKDQTWILANINAVGIYRVNYDDKNWDKLLILLMKNRDAIPVINRAQLIDDAFSLARGRHIRISRALETTHYLHTETEHLPWDMLSNHLDFMKLILSGSPSYSLLEEYILSKVRPVYQYFMELAWAELDTAPTDSCDQFAQEVVAGLACSNGLWECHKVARNLYSLWMAQPDVNPVPPSLRPVVYCRSVTEGGQAEWDFAWKMYELANSAAEAEILRYSLACSVNASVLDRYLSLTMMPWKIKRQDALATIVLVAQNINGKKPAWNFIKTNWATLISEFSTAEAIVGLLEGVTSRSYRRRPTGGKGLGQREDGIAEPIKVKVKCDTAGIGHKLGEQFTFHWWDHIFNKAAADIVVETQEDGVVLQKVTSGGQEEGAVSNKKPRRAAVGREMLYGRFVKATTLTPHREQAEAEEPQSSDSSDQDEALDLSSTRRLTDEELLRACGGRTAHKGARHGLTMKAKLLRLEEQEQEFLAKYGQRGRTAGAEAAARTDVGKGTKMNKWLAKGERPTREEGPGIGTPEEEGHRLKAKKHKRRREKEGGKDTGIGKRR